jgi:hypothetical protein
MILPADDFDLTVLSDATLDKALEDIANDFNLDDFFNSLGEDIE